ncbi:[Fe-Fe] hydrogenase large subunit C-terminal domain-containing protein [Clostridium sp.]|uniref:[Fe-Fe] hydrogenase large subunit C-terminal domain-containing protein n=1 Tax=Clostridium sp. TaxID=1506 RepID=UPI0028444205|nr:[Fe-Fe] hydrogenase large subunit C-terminal domain-containing protein [Clostridium sp.]MDR3594471.1 ATP-binding protein [Clostridium sp.]
MYKFVERIYLDEEKCVGCNKCLSNCPVPGANIAYLIDGNNKIKVNSERCIHCGECIKGCEHGARYYKDDTEIFFEDLLKGKKISIIAAPSIMVNFHEYKKLFGYLKSLGVNFIYDVSFGADIAIWAYTKILKEGSLNTIIANPCSSIVNYIQKYKPELIDKLAPIHSPMLCVAIYIKKYANIDDDIAFLSPCLSKADEIDDKNTYSYVKYNVTFKKIEEYLEANNVDISNYYEYNYDNIDCNFGFLFSRPGGLKENIELYIKDAWIRQINGPKDAYNYLEDYSNNLKQNKQVPLVVDILNCSYGCNFGTGTCNKCKNFANIDEVDYKLNQLRNEKKANNSEDVTLNKTDSSHEYFDKELKLKDFKRLYDNSIIVNDIIEPSDEEYDEIFIKMNKPTEESRNINCLACGYDSCKIMAKCIYNALNILSNCIDYNKKEVINEHSLLEARSEFFTNISHELRTPLNVIYSVLQLESVYKDNLSVDNISKYNKIIKQNCLRLIRLVNNIIDISRIEAGFFKPLFKLENIVSEVEDITLSIKTYVENKRMNLVFDTEMEELYINCDINLVERIILNLLSNSVKYGKENGTIKIYIYQPDSQNVAISVKDDGIGIPEEMQKKIFDRFQKVDTSLSRKNEGSGIGLSLVKSLVELQKGTITCKSKLHNGSEFLLTFPLDSKEHKLSEEMKNRILYEKNSAEAVDIEFSDIYF